MPTAAAIRYRIIPVLHYVRHPTAVCLKTKHPRHTGKEKVITAHRTRSPTTPKHTGWSEHGRRGITLCTVAVHKRITDHAERFRDDLSMWCNFRANYFPQGLSQSCKSRPQCLSNAITPISAASITVHLMQASETQVPMVTHNHENFPSALTQPST